MEVTPDLFAWLTSLNIVDCLETINNETEGFVIPERKLELLTGGKYMDKILLSLENDYNKFYKLRLNYTKNLVQLKPVDESEEYIANSLKFYNWNILSECLRNFGLTYKEEDIIALTNGNRKILIDILNAIFSLSNELIKRTDDKLNKNTENNNTARNNTQQQNTSKNEIGKQTKSVNIQPPNKLMNNQSETIHLNKLDPKKNYINCTSPLEFFIISLCKNFDLKPRQALALLSNNRKYLLILCNKGIKNNYDNVINWIKDITFNIKALINLLKQYPDGLNIAYATIGTALCSKNEIVCLNTSELLGKIHLEFGTDWNWLIKEGIDNFIFAIIKHENNRIKILNTFCTFTGEKLSEFIIEFKKKLFNEDKNKVFSFCSCIIPHLHESSYLFFKELESFIYDMCLNETEKLSESVSLLADCWYYFSPIDENVQNNIISYFKNIIRQNNKNSASLAGIAHLFNLMNRFSVNKNEIAPQLYKIIVFLLLENYDNEDKRQYFLLNFEKFFNNNNTIPIDILFNPYLKQLKNCKNYNLCDLVFLFKMTEHPRITDAILYDLIEFLLSVTLHDLILSRTANLILSLIFEKKLIDNLCEDDQMEEIAKLFVDYINTILDLYISNLNNMEDKAILETACDIISENIYNVNDRLHDQIVEACYKYREIKHKNSEGLLAMLWTYEDHDNVLLLLEEKYRIIYDPVQVEEEKNRLIQEEKDKKNYTKKAQKIIQELNTKLKEEKLNKFEKEKQKSEARQKQIKNNLTKIRERKNIMLGIIPENIKDEQKEDLSMYNAINNATMNLKNKTKMYSASLPGRQGNDKNVDLLKKYSNVMSAEKKKKYDHYMEEKKYFDKIKSYQTLILPEGTVIKEKRMNYNNSLSCISKKARRNYVSSEVYKNFILPINLEEEEERESKAIEGYIFQYQNSLKFFFRAYADESTQTITKPQILRMFRERGFVQDELCVEELNIAMRNLFEFNIADLTFEQFSALLIQLSYLIYTKNRDTLTISECFGNLLRNFLPKKNTQGTEKLKKKYQPCIDLILQKMTNPKDEDDQYFNMPPGFKLKNKTIVKYNSRLAPHFVDIIGESNYVCYEIVETILFNIFESSTIEPYIRIDKSNYIELDPATCRQWSPGITMAYIKLDTDYEKIGKECANVLQEMIDKLCQIKNMYGYPVKVEKKEQEAYKKYLEEQQKQIIKRNKRNKKLKEQLEKYRNEQKAKLAKKKEKEKKDREKYIQLINEDKEKNKKKVEEIKERKKIIDEEKKNKFVEEQEKLKKYKDEKYQQRKEYLKSQRRKLKEQFKKIKNLKNKFWKGQYESIPANQKLPSTKDSLKDPNYYKKSIAEYKAFEKIINEKVNEILKREDIQKAIEQYQNHINVVYDVYSKLGLHKISFYENQSIKITEFKEFLVNFSVLGLIISSEQMNYIYQKITFASRKDKDGEQQNLTLQEFILSLIFITLLSKSPTKSTKITQNDIDNLNPQDLTNFFEYLGFKLPFKKLELENNINERRSMTVKKLLELQREMRKEKLKGTSEQKKDEQTNENNPTNENNDNNDTNNNNNTTQNENTESNKEDKNTEQNKNNTAAKEDPKKGAANNKPNATNNTNSSNNKPNATNNTNSTNNKPNAANNKPGNAPKKTNPPKK